MPEFLFSPTHRPPLSSGDIPGTRRGWVNTGAVVWTEGLRRSNQRSASTNCATPYLVHTAQDAINYVTMMSWMFDVQPWTCYPQTSCEAADLNVLKPRSKLSSKISSETTVRFQINNNFLLNTLFCKLCIYQQNAQLYCSAPARLGFNLPSSRRKFELCLKPLRT
jgi:hypothetical protein